MYVAIGMIVAYLPRLYYLCKLCGYNCCGGKTKDTSTDRYALVQAMNALIVSIILTAILTIVITLAVGGNFAGSVLSTVIQSIINGLFVLWWRMDISKWVENKKAMEAK